MPLFVSLYCGVAAATETGAILGFSCTPAADWRPLFGRHQATFRQIVNVVYQVLRLTGDFFYGARSVRTSSIWDIGHERRRSLRRCAAKSVVPAEDRRIDGHDPEPACHRQKGQLGAR